MDNPFDAIVDQEAKTKLEAVNTPTPDVNPYDAIVDAEVKAKQDQTAMRGNLYQAVNTNTADYTQKRKDAVTLGYPVAAVQNLADAATDAKVKRIVDATQDTPVLQRLYQGEDFGKAAYGDVNTLAPMEKMFSGQPSPEQSYIPGFSDIRDLHRVYKDPKAAKKQAADEVHLKLAVPDSPGQEVFSVLEDFTTPYVSELYKTIGANPVVEQFLGGFIHTGSLGLVPSGAPQPTNIPQAIAKAGGDLAGFVGGAPLKVTERILADWAKLFTPRVGNSWVKDTALNVGHSAATLGMATALQNLGEVINSASLPEAADKAVKAGRGGAAVGAVFGVTSKIFPDATNVQFVARMMANLIGMDIADGKIPFQDITGWDKLTPEQQGSAVFNLGLNAFFSRMREGGNRSSGGWIRPDTELRNKISEDVKFAKKSEQADTSLRALEGLSVAASNSKLREENPDLFHQFVNEVADGSEIKHIYVPIEVVKKIFEPPTDTVEHTTEGAPEGAKADTTTPKEGGEVSISMVGHKSEASVEDTLNMFKLWQSMPEVVEQVHSATELNGDVAIPIADWLTKISGTPLEKALINDAKIDPDGLTMNEAKAHKLEEGVKNQALIEKIITENTKTDEQKADYKFIYDDILGKLSKNSSFGKEANAVQAKLISAMLFQAHESEGISVRDLHEAYSLEMDSKVTDDGYNQINDSMKSLENQVGVLLGARPGSFGSKYWNKLKPGPILESTSRVADQNKLGDEVHKLLSTKGVKDLAKDAFGITNLRVTKLRGSWNGNPETSFMLHGDKMTFESATAFSKMLGLTFAREATVVTQPLHKASPKESQSAFYLGNNKKLTKAQITAVEALAKEHKLDYTTSVDGTGFKFVHYEKDGSTEAKNKADYQDLGDKLNAIAEQTGLD